MKIEGTTACFKSVTPFFAHERTGAKPHTVRVVTSDEARAIYRCDSVRIMHEPEKEQFTEAIMFVSDITNAINASEHAHIDDGYRMLDICWDGAR
jgi:hypothetical protein